MIPNIKNWKKIAIWLCCTVRKMDVLSITNHGNLYDANFVLCCLLIIIEYSIVVYIAACELYI